MMTTPYHFQNTELMPLTLPDKHDHRASHQNLPLIRLWNLLFNTSNQVGQHLDDTQIINKLRNPYWWATRWMDPSVENWVPTVENWTAGQKHEHNRWIFPAQLHDHDIPSWDTKGVWWLFLMKMKIHCNANITQNKKAMDGGPRNEVQSLHMLLRLE